MLGFLTRPGRQDSIYALIQEAFDSGDINAFMQEMVRILYKAGVVGLKPLNYATVHWSHEGHKLTTSETDPEAMVYIHPAFWRVLGTQVSD